MAVQRTRFIPWLIDQINSGRYPGVNWTNEEKTEFCIPWKHGLRQDSSSCDILIFKAWAEVNMEGERSCDPTVWKRNFRSALRAKGFKIVVDNRNDAANPHKVFRLPDGESQQNGERSRRQSRREAMEDNTASVGLQELNGYKSPVPAQCLSVAFLQLNPTFPGQSCLPPGLPSPHHLPGAQMSYHVPQDPGIGQDQLSAFMKLNISEAQEIPVSFVPEMYCVDGAVSADQTLQHQAVEQQDKIDRTIADKDLSTNFRVSVYYRGVKVLEQLVEGRAGFRVAFRPEQLHQSTLPPENDPLSGVVSLPGPGQVSIPDQLQVQLTRRILDKLGDGLEVWVEGSVVYGRRRGDTRIYWSLCKHKKSDAPQELGKDGDELYTLSYFVTALVEFMKKGEGEAPSFSLFFCLGEKWPDQRPWEKKLIMVEVVLTTLETLKMIAVEGGASSLRSVELQLSGTSSLMDALMDWMESC